MHVTVAMLDSSSPLRHQASDNPPQHCCKQFHEPELVKMDRFCPDDPKAIDGPAIAVCVLASVAFCLRIASRLMSRAGLWWDDFLLLPAFVSNFWFDSGMVPD